MSAGSSMQTERKFVANTCRAGIRIISGKKLIGLGLMEDAISKMLGKPKPRAEPGAEAQEPGAPRPENATPAQPPAAACSPSPCREQKTGIRGRRSRRGAVKPK
jgi:hypothetical protein